MEYGGGEHLRILGFGGAEALKNGKKLATNELSELEEAARAGQTAE